VPKATIDEGKKKRVEEGRVVLAEMNKKVEGR